MRFTCTKENLVHVLDLVSSLANRQNNLPILLNVLINVEDSKVELITTNLEVAVKANLRAKVEEKGSFTVPAKTLTDYVHLLTSDQVEITLEENELLLKCGNSSTKIKGSPAEEYPVIPEVEEKHPYVVHAEDFKNSLSKAVVAVAKNEIRPELSGVYFGFNLDRSNEQLVMAATDSYRLSESKVKIAQGADKNVEVIVPSRVVYEFIRLINLSHGKEGEQNVRLWVSENQIAMRYDNFETTSRLIDGKYPDYSQIIPKAFKTTAKFSIEVMVNKIKAASIFTTTGVNAVSFDLNASQNSIGVSSTSTQTGEHSSELDCKVEGEENSILLNHRYVLDGLQQMETEEGVFQVNSADSPCLFLPDGKDNFLYIVMPIRQ